MIIELTNEEAEFLERMVKRAVVFSEMREDAFQRLKDSDYQKAKRLLDKFIIERMKIK